MLTTPNPALLIIDVQHAIDHFSILERSNPDMEEKLADTLAKWRAAKHPIIHVRHSSKSHDSPYHKTSPFYEFKEAVMPLADEIIITKQENTAFINTELDQTLQAMNITELVIFGVLTNHSIDATVRVGAALGYNIFLPLDLTAAGAITLLDGTVINSEDAQKIYLSNLDGEYCKVCYSKDLFLTF